VAVCSESDPGSQACSKIGDLVDKRTRETLWDVDVPRVHKGKAESAGEASSVPEALRSFLSLTYRPYNDIAADVLMTAPTRLDHWQPTLDANGKERFSAANAATDWRFAPAITPRPPINAAPWLIAGALMAVAYMLVRYLLRPIFALELGSAVTLLDASGASDDTCLLVLGRRPHPVVRRGSHEGNGVR
jgi:hypothetical protein